MRVEFLNHASLLLDCGSVRIVMDPWFEGAAFNDGWELIAATRFGPADWARVTHLWFSHEHPDHFSPRTLRAIPETSRRQIRVLYQASRDRKIVEFCKKLAFADVQECPAGAWMTLAPDVALRCDPHASGDSWLAVKSGARTFLNLNDCLITQLDQARVVRDAVGDVDLLATQFSISAWDGNPEEAARLRAGAEAMLDRMVTQVEVLKARWTIPFASFVHFSHVENRFLNAFHNSIELAAETLAQRTATQPIVMYPGDVWTLGEAHDNQPALARWAEDTRAAALRPAHAPKPVELERLAQSAARWCERVAAIADPLRLRVSLARLRWERVAAQPLARLAAALALRPPVARIWLEDHQRAFRFSHPDGLHPISATRPECEVSLSSDSLQFAFDHLFGGESLLVNARFRELAPGSRRALFGYFEFAAGVNQGMRLGWGGLSARLLRMLGR